MGDFFPRCHHAFGDFLWPILAAQLKAPLQLRHAGWQQENTGHISRHAGLQLPMALPFNVEQHITPFSQCGLHRRTRGAIAAAKKHRMFQQITARDHGVIFGHVAEMVMHAILFTRTRCAGGDTDGKL